jgi:hypothetical protein
MLKFAADFMVNRPVEQVFAWLTNAENQGKFDKSSLKMEALTPGPWRAGTQFRELRDLGGRQTEVLSEVAELEPNRQHEADYAGWRRLMVETYRTARMAHSGCMSMLACGLPSS